MKFRLGGLHACEGKNCPRPEGMPEDLWRLLHDKKIPCPSDAQLSAILKAGKGEHQDRLWSLCWQQATERYFEEIKFCVISHNLTPKDVARMLGAPDDLLEDVLDDTSDSDKPQLAN